ncbi:hypothetical protein [Phaeobacter sp.]|uniref:hypothetical protein n=1 Tax=Phaeobacter sp. TaxID=1902409 RepID=UPI0025F7DEA2|nr:hypothetical protein [Phaeobacter sp.]
MDYSRMGGVKPGRNKPRHAEHNAKGTANNPYDKTTDKAALLARMKAAAEKGKKDVSV